MKDADFQLLVESIRQAGRIKRGEMKTGEGDKFEVAPVRRTASPLEIEGVPLGLTAGEIVSIIRETRARESG